MISQLFRKNNPENPEEKPAGTEEKAETAQEEAPAEETTGKKKKEKKKKTPMQELISCILTFLAALAIATFVRAYWVEPVRVDGTSMTNTLQDGEIVLVSKSAYRKNDPQRNDIVICRYPKRVDREINLGAALAVTQYEIFVKRRERYSQKCRLIWARMNISSSAITAIPPTTAAGRMWAPSPAARSWAR